MLKARIIHALGGKSIPFSLSDGDVLREEDSIKSLGERSALNFPLIPLSRPLVFIINSLSVASRSKSSFAGDDAADDEWLFLLSLAWAFNSISWTRSKEKFNLFELVMDSCGEADIPFSQYSSYLQLQEKPLGKCEWGKTKSQQEAERKNKVSSPPNNSFSTGWYFQHVDVYNVSGRLRFCLHCHRKYSTRLINFIAFLIYFAWF